MKKPYKPQKDSFPWRVITYLYENGESSNKDIRREIGLDEWAKQSKYSDRSGYYFACIIARLIKKGIVVRTKRAHYKLADSKC